MALAATFVAAAQVEGTETMSVTDDAIYSVVDQDPEFPGGMEGLYQWLATNIKYPEKARQEGIQGRVFVTFVIEKDGTVNNVRVIRSPNEELSEEAIRVVQSMPKWKPGRAHVKGKKEAVRVQYNLPINFKL